MNESKYIWQADFVNVVATEKGFMILMPDGNPIPAVVDVVVSDMLDKAPEVTVKMRCNMPSVTDNYITGAINKSPERIICDQKIEQQENEIKELKEVIMSMRKEAYESKKAPN